MILVRLHKEETAYREVFGFQFLDVMARACDDFC